MNKEYECLLKLDEIKKMLGIIIVEGFDEKYGFSDSSIKAIVHCKYELEEVLRLLAKTKSSALYDSIVDNKLD